MDNLEFKRKVDAMTPEERSAEVDRIALHSEITSEEKAEQTYILMKSLYPDATLTLEEYKKVLDAFKVF